MHMCFTLYACAHSCFTVHVCVCLRVYVCGNERRAHISMHVCVHPSIHPYIRRSVCPSVHACISSPFHSSTRPWVRARAQVLFRNLDRDHNGLIRHAHARSTGMRAQMHVRKHACHRVGSWDEFLYGFENFIHGWKTENSVAELASLGKCFEAM